MRCDCTDVESTVIGRGDVSEQRVGGGAAAYVKAPTKILMEGRKRAVKGRGCVCTIKMCWGISTSMGHALLST